MEAMDENELSMEFVTGKLLQEYERRQEQGVNGGNKHNGTLKADEKGATTVAQKHI